MPGTQKNCPACRTHKKIARTLADARRASRTHCKKMSTRLTRLPEESCALPEESHALLRSAIKHWHDTAAFTDEHVVQVAFQSWRATGKQQTDEHY